LGQARRPGGARARARVLPDPGRAARAAGGDAQRRRAADAGHRAQPHGRAVPGAGADAGRGDLRHHPHHPCRRHDGAAGGAERQQGAVDRGLRLRARDRDDRARRRQPAAAARRPCAPIVPRPSLTHGKGEIAMTCITLALTLLVLLGSAPARAEDGVTDKEVVIGAGLDLTGAVANWGVNIKAGMEALFNRVNAAGGIHGRKIRLVAYDHVYQPPKAVTNAKRLVERDHVFVMMGHLGTPTTKAIKDYLDEKQVPNIFPATAASMWV